MELTDIYDSYCQTASKIKVNAVEHKLIREIEESNLHEIVVDFKTILAYNLPEAQLLKALFHLLILEADGNWLPTILFTVDSWKAILQQVHFDHERVANDEERYWYSPLILGAFDPSDFAQQQLDRFK